MFELAKGIKLVFDIINAPSDAGAWVNKKTKKLWREYITNAGDPDRFAKDFDFETKNIGLGGRAKSPSGMQQLNIGKIEGTDMEQWAEDYDLGIEKVVESMEELKEKAKELTKEVRTPFEVMEDSYGELVEMMNKEVIDEETFRRANEVLVSNYKQALKAKENLNKEFKNKLKAFNLDRIKLTESASEIQIAQFEKEAQKYDELVARGKISAEELKQFKIDSINKIKLQHNRAYQTMQSSIMSWGDEFGNTLTDMVMGAEVSFSDILNSFTRMIADMAVKITIIQPMMQALFGQAAGGSGSGWVGQIASALGTAVGGWVGGMSYGSTAAGLESSITSTGVITPQMSSTGLFTAPGLAEGGIATRPTAGIFGEAGAEALIPLDRMSQVMGSMGGGGSNVEINIIGAPEGTRVEESESEQGGRSIDVILDEKMSQQVKPGSKFNNQMLSQFRDMQQSTIRR
jgi:polyhydroxyalkanoate synthesis regulator phasin